MWSVHNTRPLPLINCSTAFSTEDSTLATAILIILCLYLKQDYSCITNIDTGTGKFYRETRSGVWDGKREYILHT